MDRLSEEVRRLVVEAAFEAVVVLDGPTIVWCNQAMAELVGVPREDLIGRSGLDFATDDDRDRVVEAIQQARAEPYQITVVRADGARRRVEVRGRTTHVQGKPLRVTALRDRTTEVAAEEALRRSEARYRRLFEVAADGIMVMGLDGRPREVNDRFCALVGRPRESILGHAPDLVVADLDENPMRLDRLGQEGPYVISRRLRHGDGHEIVVEVAVASFGDEEAVAVFRDVTDRERAAAEKAQLRDRLQAAKRLEALSRLAGGVAHDFNNLLTVIVAATDAIRAGEVDEVGAIVEATERAAEVTAQLLDFSQHGPRRAKAFDLGDHLRGLVPLLQRLLGATELRVDIAPEPLPAHADSAQWTQVVMNLVLNAGDVTPLDQPIDVRLTREATPRGALLVLEVEDRGPGIPPEIRDRIFEPFFTTKRVGEGTGLGLSTVHGVVSMVGGHIQVESSSAGTCFRVSIPAREAAAPPAPWRSPGPRTLRVLLVEDDEPVRRSLARILVRAGHAVVEAGDLAGGRAALATAGVFDVILSDVVMPNGSGVGILADAGDVPVILMSGFPREDLVGAPPSVRFLAKPFGSAELLAALELVADQKGMSSPGKGTSSP
ncbi:MAG: PAS domain S-box protein [Sandaracinaceae bacterium]